MEFANPAFLWTLAAAALPLALHLFARRRRAQVQFSTLMFFTRQRRNLSLRRRLRELLILTLRTLALIILAMALARPFINKHGFISNGATSSVIVLDDSASMQRQLVSGASAFNLASQLSQNILEAASPDDSSALITLTGQHNLPLTQDKSRLIGQLKQFLPNGAGASLTHPLENAARILENAPGINREIYLISDFQSNMKPASPLSIPHARIFCLPLKIKESPPFLSHLNIDNTPKITGNPCLIRVSVTNPSQTDCNITVSLLLPGSAPQSRLLSMPRNSTRNLTFTHVPDQPGRVNGHIRIDTSPDAPNATMFFSFKVSGNIKTLLLKSPGPDPFLFLRHALDPGSTHPHGIETHTVDTNVLSLETLKDTRLVFCAPNSPIPANCAGLLLQFIRQGGTLISIPDPGSAKRDFAPLATASNHKLLNPYRDELHSREEGLQFSPPLDHLNSNLQLNIIKWKQLTSLNPALPQTLATINKHPAIAAQSLGQGQWIACAFGPRRNSGNWPELKSFPISIVYLAHHAAGNLSRDIHAPCGTPVKLDGDNITYTSSGGKHGHLPSAHGQASFTEGWLPGWVSLVNASADTLIFNTPSSETDSKAMNDKEINAAFSGHATMIDPGQPLMPQIAKLRKGRELTGLLLLLLIAVIVAEHLLCAAARPTREDTP